jgi:hypothetical protein
MGRVRALKWNPLNILLMLILMLILSACSDQATETAVQLETATDSSPTPTEVIPPTPTNVPSPEPYARNLSCVGCHTDKDQLISTVSQVEETKPESSGEG